MSQNSYYYNNCFSLKKEVQGVSGQEILFMGLKTSKTCLEIKIKQQKQ